MSVLIYTWLQADDRFIAMYTVLCGISQILHTYVQVQDTYSGIMPNATGSISSCTPRTSCQYIRKDLLNAQIDAGFLTTRSWEHNTAVLSKLCNQ